MMKTYINTAASLDENKTNDDDDEKHRHFVSEHTIPTVRSHLMG